MQAVQHVELGFQEVMSAVRQEEAPGVSQRWQKELPGGRLRQEERVVGSHQNAPGSQTAVRGSRAWKTSSCVQTRTWKRRSGRSSRASLRRTMSKSRIPPDTPLHGGIRLGVLPHGRARSKNLHSWALSLRLSKQKGKSPTPARADSKAKPHGSWP